MLETFTKTSLRLFICPNVKAHTLKSLSGIPRSVEIYCNIDIEGINHNFYKHDINIEKLRTVTHNNVSVSKLMELTNLAIQLEIPKDNIIELFDASTKMGLSVGLKPVKSIESVIIGIGRKSIRRLDNIGVVFEAKDAYNKYSDMDKAKAWKKYAIEKVKEKANSL